MAEQAAEQDVSDGTSALKRSAEQIFQLQIMFWAVRHKNRTDDPCDLTEPEFITLDRLVREGVCTVGTLQKALAVQPAQMSRIIRSLENKGDKKLVACQLNAQDKRRIDVSITSRGRRAHRDYQDLRLRANMALLGGLSAGEQGELSRLLDRFGQIMSEQLAGGE